MNRYKISSLILASLLLNACGQDKTLEGANAASAKAANANAIYRLLNAKTHDYYLTRTPEEAPAGYVNQGMKLTLNTVQSNAEKATIYRCDPQADTSPTSEDFTHVYTDQLNNEGEDESCFGPRKLLGYASRYLSAEFPLPLFRCSDDFHADLITTDPTECKKQGAYVNQNNVMGYVKQ